MTEEQGCLTANKVGSAVSAVQAGLGRNIQHMWLVKRLDSQMMGAFMGRYIGWECCMYLLCNQRPQIPVVDVEHQK